ncbi:MAG: portal protein [Sulfuriferula sp.]
MDDTLKDDLAAFKAVAEAEKDQRASMLDDLEFVKLGKQWPQDVIDKRAKEGRPCLVINRLPAFGKQVTNDARQNRPAIKCHPVGDKSDRETAEILNGLIKNIEYSSNADIAYDTGLDHSVFCGVGYWTVNIDYASDDSFDKDIRIERVANPLAVYGDPASTSADSGDWNSAFITDRITEKEFKKRYPDASVANFEADDSREEEWYEEDMIRIAERWFREQVKVKLLKLSDGSLMLEPQFLKIKDILQAQSINVTGDRDTLTYKVSQRIITGAEVLETNDWVGKYIPIVPCYGDEVNVNGKRSFQSLFHFAKDPQRNYNYWRTAATESVALAPKTPFIGPEGAFNTDADKWATANTDSHAYIQYDGQQAPQRQPFVGVPAGHLQEALNASDDLKNIMGLHDASLGAQSNETSGRAIMARQREGDVATFNFIDNQSRAIRHTGRILVDLIPKIYDVERIIRCIKEDGTNYSVPINQPVQQIQPQPGQPDQAPQYQPISPEQAEELHGLTRVFDLAAGKYDVTCESGPSFTSRREESAQQMMQFVQSFPAAGPLVGDLIAKNLDWPGADEMAKRLQAMLPPQAKGDKPPELMQAEQAIQQLQGQLQQQGQQLQDKQGDMQLRQGELQIKGQELKIKQFDAETKRIALQQKANQPGEQPIDNSFEAYKLQLEDGLTRWKTEQDNNTKLMIAQMGHQASFAHSAMDAESAQEDAGKGPETSEK